MFQETTSRETNLQQAESNIVHTDEEKAERLAKLYYEKKCLFEKRFSTPLASVSKLKRHLSLQTVETCQSRQLAESKK